MFKFDIKVKKKIQIAGKDGAPRSSQEAEIIKKMEGLNAYFFIGIKFLNGISIFASIWAFIMPLPYRFVIALCALAFLSAIAAFIYSKGIVLFNASEGSKAVNVSVAIAGPSLALAWRGFCDFHFVQAGDLRLPVGVLFFCLSVLVYIKAMDFNLRARAYLSAIPFIFAFSFGAIVQANGLFYSEILGEYKASVISKQISTSGDGPHMYYLMVTGWMNRADNNRLIVPRIIYDSFKNNDEVRIRVRRGFLDIPYYFVIKKGEGNNES